MAEMVLLVLFGLSLVVSLVLGGAYDVGCLSSLTPAAIVFLVALVSLGSWGILSCRREAKTPWYPRP